MADTRLATADEAIIWEIFSNVLTAIQDLGYSGLEGLEIVNALRRLPKPKIGLGGQFQEWRDEVAIDYTGDDHHRHANHLYGLHPGHQIIVGRSSDEDKYADAIRRTLITRGDEGTGWSKAWKINFWARLHDGDHAYLVFQQLLRNSTLKNLWDTHPPFQIDGNFGATAGITELLLQSQGEIVQLLPALPSVWSSSGSVRGLKARGGYQVDVVWSEGKVTNATIKAVAAKVIKVSGPGIDKNTKVTTLTGEAVETSAYNNNGIQWNTEGGITYTVTVA